MARDELKLKNSTGLILTVYLRSSETGQGLSGKSYSDFSGQWNRGNTASAALSFAAGTVGDAHSSGKIAELGNGRYYWHVPDSLFTSLGQVVATFQVDGAIDVKLEWQVVEVDRDVAAFGANTTTPLEPVAIQAAAAAAIATANLAKPGDEMALTPANLTALFADVDVAGLVASVTAAFDDATDLPVQTIAAEAATRTVAAVIAHAQIVSLIANAASANAAAMSVDAKLTVGRAAKLDRDLAHAGDAATYQAAVPTVEDIDTRLSTTHGSGSWGGGSGSSLTGPNAITVTITDSATEEPIEAASIRFYRTGASGRSSTNADGAAVFAVESATWTVAISAAGYESKTATLVISGDATPEFTLESITVSPPGTGGLCRVRVPVREAATAAVGARVEAQLVDENQAVGNDLVARSITRAQTDVTGYADLLLPQGLTYQIEGFYGNHRFLLAEYSVPATAEAYLAASL